MFADAFHNIVPLRAIALQSVFLLMAIAIEAAVYQRQLSLDPKPSVYYAAAMNMFCVVVGWLAFFILLDLLHLIPNGIQTPMMSFIFFDQWSGETATLLIVAGFIIFFASIGIKLLALLGLRMLLQTDRKPEPEPEPDNAPKAGIFRELRQEPHALRAEIITLLFANAWSYSAILIALVIRQAFI
jgi:hypothetical protein